MTDAGLDWCNGLDGGDQGVEREFRTCCAAPTWAAALAAGRPYADRAALLAESTRLLRSLDWAEILLALGAHPRIGERVAGNDREAAWSKGEQSGMDTATAEVRAALVEANLAYEARFGHVFLIAAAGRTDREMLAAARDRLEHDPGTEQGIVRSELIRIAALRLEKLLDAHSSAEGTG